MCIFFPFKGLKPGRGVSAVAVGAREARGEGGRRAERGLGQRLRVPGPYKAALIRLSAFADNDFPQSSN